LNNPKTRIDNGVIVSVWA